MCGQPSPRPPSPSLWRAAVVLISLFGYTVPKEGGGGEGEGKQRRDSVTSQGLGVQQKRSYFL